MNTKQIIIGAAVAGLAGIIGYVSGHQTADPSMQPLTDASESVSIEREILYWQAPMNPTEIYDSPGKSSMGMDLIPVYGDASGAGTSEMIVIDPTIVQNMGVRSSVAHRMDFSRMIRTVGEVTYDEGNLYQINARISGWIEKLHVNYVGAPVRKGDPLLEIYSPELVTTQEEYLLAYQQLKLARSTGQQIAIQDAERLLNSARRRIDNWEIPPDVIRHLEETGEPARTVLLRSPATGIVKEKSVVEGARVTAGMDLFQLADLSTVWVHASFYEDEVPWITTGQSVEMELSYLPGKTYDGTVSYVYPYLREKARDVHVRLIFSNPNLDLKPGMYVNVQLQGRVILDALVVPTEAVIRSGQRMIVFVVRGGGKFEPREVRIGEEGGPRNDYVRILSGLSEGESIVVSAQFLLDSESRLQEAIRKMLDVGAPGEMGEMEDMKLPEVMSIPELED